MSAEVEVGLLACCDVRVADDSSYGCGAYYWAGVDYLVARGGAVSEGARGGGYGVIAFVGRVGARLLLGEAGWVLFWPVFFLWWSAVLFVRR